MPDKNRTPFATDFHIAMHLQLRWQQRNHIAKPKFVTLMMLISDYEMTDL